ncbi:uncharacterized protein Z520_04560 [Fonsecaea multimorphosa CBS 102226]|uniref:Methyltransferase domain-containing protein n=1 Tax=Fonsecaea multimorphosa CBS 102226 TaxID=1442371 RepID=A0A0D2KT86_9EURO|nr:uncharacterized protein Z520_04560 [Fonsecaea multimorphosa CBS 102226]KIX99923.1 hypothetical protein Z520_04560 [Fonsecaea multimorphosa CBS 102226]OAL26398.1 hypothetical protein AYO22_04316 [Fonsecaea multimorphosa]
MAEAARLYIECSRIPHLALSISAKRAAARSTSTACLNRQRLLSCSVGRSSALSTPRQAVRTTAYSSSFHLRSRRHASTTKQTVPNPNIPRPLGQSQPQHKPRPTLLDRATAQDALDHLAAKNRRQRIHMSSNTYFWITSLFGFLLSTYVAYTYMSYTRSVKEYENRDDLPQNADVSSRWMDLSRNFDDEVELSEKLMFLRSKREKLCREARGNVLEVSAGTGRNMGLYRLDPLVTPEDKRVESLVFNDLSEIMLYQAQKKFEESQEKVKDKRRFPGPVQFVVGDAGDKNLIKRPEGGFDTIIQTMGVCSETNPVAFLRQLGELCRQPGEKSSGVDMKIIEKESQQRLEDITKRKDRGVSELDPEQKRQQEEDALVAEYGGDLGGKILLLEHGRSYLGFINRVLDNGAKMHADHYGCWWNKDIEQIVKDSGLIVERKRRYHFGTTYEYVLRPRPKSRSGDEKTEKTWEKVKGGKNAVVDLSQGVQVKGWTGGWFGRN